MDNSNQTVSQRLVVSADASQRILEEINRLRSVSETEQKPDELRFQIRTTARKIEKLLVAHK